MVNSKRKLKTINHFKISKMTKEIAERLAPLFKKDFKKARFKAGCVTMYPNLNGFKNKAAERKYDRLCMMFDLTKELYLECLEVLGKRIH